MAVMIEQQVCQDQGIKAYRRVWELIKQRMRASTPKIGFCNDILLFSFPGSIRHDSMLCWRFSIKSASE